MEMDSLAREKCSSDMTHQVRYIGGMTPCWDGSEVLAMQQALNTVRLLEKGLLGCLLLDNTGIAPFCKMLTFGLDAIFGNLEVRCLWVVLFL